MAVFHLVVPNGVPPDRSKSTLVKALLIMEFESTYLCNYCGEEIVVPVDITQGTEQEYVEDCPVCCSPNVLHVSIAPSGDVFIDAQPEHDPV